MHAEYIECVVVAEGILHRRHEDEAHRTDDQAQHERAHRAGVARRRRDRDQTRDATRYHAEQRGLTLDRPFGKHPRERSGRGGDE